MKDKLEPNMYVITKDGDMFILDKIEDNHLIPIYVHMKDKIDKVKLLTIIERVRWDI